MEVKRDTEINRWLARGVLEDQGELRGRAQAYNSLHRELLSLKERELED